MLIIPAIDLKDGKCVRLQQGDPNLQTVYGQDPVAVAKQWLQAGAQLIHIVDLDGAFSGKSHHLDIIKAITSQTSAAIQLGGGLRSLQVVQQVLEAGAQRAILGTIAWENPQLVQDCVDKFGPRILVGIDARDGYVAIKGWVETTKVKAVDLAKRVKDQGVAQVIVTDIARDGMLTGPNLDSIQEILDLGLKVIASGGISSLDDIRSLAGLNHPNLTGIITGKALYSGAFKLEEAIQLAQQLKGGSKC